MHRDDDHGEFFTAEQVSDVMCLDFIEQPEYVPGMLVDIVNELGTFLPGHENRPFKALVLHPPPGLMAPEFFDKVMATHGLGSSGETADPQNPMAHHAMETDIIREINATQRLITGIRRIKGFVVAAISGKTVLSLFGPALACNFRIVSEDFTLVNRKPYSGFTPWGAVPWFLTRILGCTKAWALLTAEKDINAHQALDLGLVDKIVPAAQLKETSVALAQTHVLRPWSIRVALKQAMDCADAPLEEYLEKEKALFLSVLEQSRVSAKDG